MLIENGASSNRIGTDGESADDAGERNLISGNSYNGVEFYGSGTSQNILAGNFIGTDVTGSLSLGNTEVGVLLVEGASSNWIGVNPDGGTAVGDEGNVISGSGYAGVSIWWGTDENVVAGNLIGTDSTGTASLPNGGPGIDIEESSSNNTIGGTNAAAGNLITNNGGPGVDVVGTAFGNVVGTAVGDQITGNRIFGNTGQAIDLGNDGVTYNAPSPRQGPNNLQNFPIIFTAANGQLEGGLWGSLPDTTFRIDFFASSADNSDGSGEAEDDLGSMEVTTDDQGQVVFDVPYTPPAGLPIVTATATDPQGNTSEVSAQRRPILQAPAQTVRLVHGQATIFSTASGDPIALQDPDAGPFNPTWNLTLSVAAGTLTLSSTAGLAGSGDGTGTLHYSGPSRRSTRPLTV